MHARFLRILTATGVLCASACGGGSVAAPPLTASPVVPATIDVCSGFPLQPATAGTVVRLSASDVAAFPNAASCAAAASLQNGAFLVTEGASESAVDTVAGIAASNVDTLTANAGPTIQSASPNAVAFALDADGALSELVVTGDPSETQAEVDAWTASVATISARMRKQGVASLTTAWTKMLTRTITAHPDATRYASAPNTFRRVTAIYRLNSTDLSSDYYLVNNEVTTNEAFKAGYIPSPVDTRKLSESLTPLDAARSTIDGYPVFDHGPTSISASVGEYTVGSVLEGGDSASAAFSASWNQPGVETIDDSTLTMTSWTETIAPSSPNYASRFSSYNSALFRVDDVNLFSDATPFPVQITVTSTTTQPVNPPDTPIQSERSTFVIRPPRFSVSGQYSKFTTNALVIFADNGNGGVLRWKLINSPDSVTVVPSQGAGDTLLTLVPKSTAVPGDTSVLEFQTIPPYVVPSLKNQTLYVTVQIPDPKGPSGLTASDATVHR